MTLGVKACGRDLWIGTKFVCLGVLMEPPSPLVSSEQQLRSTKASPTDTAHTLTRTKTSLGCLTPRRIFAEMLCECEV